MLEKYLSLLAEKFHFFVVDLETSGECLEKFCKGDLVVWNLNLPVACTENLHFTLNVFLKSEHRTILSLEIPLEELRWEINYAEVEHINFYLVSIR